MPDFPDNWSDLNVVLCHDWLTGMRGGERVLDILCRAFPKAPIFTLIHNPSAVSDTINAHQITTSWLQSIPGITNNYRCFLPLFPSAIERLAVPDADLIISTSHCIAKGIRAKPGTKHVCVCFTPMRYAWTFYHEYFGHSLLKALIAGPMLPALRKWDLNASQRVDKFAAISKHVQKRIKDFYGRESDIAYPPVDIERWTPDKNSHADFDLIISALVPYKRVDLAVSAYTQLGYPLKIVGVGSELKRLRMMAGLNIEFLGRQSDDNLLELYRSCRLLVFPGEEDFGIVPLEAQACGRPVVAYRKGGALETVTEDISGVFFDEQTKTSLLDAIDKCASSPWDPVAIRANAEKFSAQNFIDSLSQIITQTLSE